MSWSALPFHLFRTRDGNSSSTRTPPLSTHLDVNYESHYSQSLVPPLCNFGLTFQFRKMSPERGTVTTTNPFSFSLPSSPFRNLLPHSPKPGLLEHYSGHTGRPRPLVLFIRSLQPNFPHSKRRT